MDRLISEQAILQAIKEPIKKMNCRKSNTELLKNVEQAIKAIPSADIDTLIDGADAVGYRRGYKEAQLNISSADMFSDLKAEISMYENSEQSIDEMIQGIKSIISIYER
ncbi:MAG: hypothetical protein J6S67_12150 [Methanobrevibacter sp.]|nr:hypothetical protein [Methanobrevibacter sp.]